MKILVKKVKMLRRIATTPKEFNIEIERESSPTYKEVVKSFENNVEETKENKMSAQKKDASKRPLSDSSNTSPAIQPERKINSMTETELSNLFSKDVDISMDSSTEDNDLKSFTDLCCSELIQKCTGRYFTCACKRQYYKCSCGWKIIGREKRAYQCETCRNIVAKCVGCGSFQMKKKGKLFQCENCHCQLTKELHRSSAF